METPIDSIKKYVRAANYLTVAQLYLQDNYLLETRLQPRDIKERLLGHWGTCPGINFIYANLNWLIKKHEAEMLFVMGPGHGFPALQANLFLEETLAEYYPDAVHTKTGIGYISKNFSWPYGFPSHSNPGAPGAILEGGELGYSLSTAYGAVLDNPNLIAACVIGDGEAETGPLATAWHLNKLVDPKINGAVLPILHLNGYKISGPTMMGRMSDKELKSLFTGYGYEPIIVSGSSDVVYKKMAEALEGAYLSIRGIQSAARSGTASPAPRFPMIILRTPKGWTGIKELRGEKLEGNFASHQIIAKNAREDKEDLKALSKWLHSYKFSELFNESTGFVAEVKDVVPPAHLRMGKNKHAFGGEAVCKPLALPAVAQYSEDASVPGKNGSSSMKRAGLFLNDVFKLNASESNFRLFSPDETYSNKLDAVFASTTRAFVWPLLPWDKDISPVGRVMEMLSEHSLQGLLQGYVLTGRHGIFASYEAFIQIISSMADQYAKFLRIAADIEWRGDIPSLNYILTSSGWRQEHNGFSHQNPGFIDDMLQRQDRFVHVYFPPDGNSTLVCLDKCLRSRNGINLLVAGKTLEPLWLTPEQAEAEAREGLAVWDFASDAEPDVVVSAAGDYMTKEALAAISIVRAESPEVKMRFVNIMEISAFGLGNQDLNHSAGFARYFTEDKPVVFNFHGYPQTLKQILFDYGESADRFSIHGYVENGSTTTPFDMQVRNRTDRFHLAMDVWKRANEGGVITEEKLRELTAKYEVKLAAHVNYIKERGVDMDEIANWQWSR